jgi:hypothetical protein
MAILVASHRAVLRTRRSLPPSSSKGTGLVSRRVGGRWACGGSDIWSPVSVAQALLQLLPVTAISYPKKLPKKYSPSTYPPATTESSDPPRNTRLGSKQRGRAPRPPSVDLATARSTPGESENEPKSPPTKSTSKHRRRCYVCKHPDCEAIEEAFFQWRRTAT